MKSLNDSIKESFEILLENISFKKPQGIASGYPRFDNMLRCCLFSVGSLIFL